MRGFERRALARAPLGSRGGPLLPGRWEGAGEPEEAATPARPADGGAPPGVGSPGLGAREAARLLDALVAGSPASDCESVQLSLGNSSGEEEVGAPEVPAAAAQPRADRLRGEQAKWGELSALCADLDRPGFRDFAPDSQSEPALAGGPPEGATSGAAAPGPSEVHARGAPPLRAPAPAPAESDGPRSEEAPPPVGPAEEAAEEALGLRLRRSVAAAEQLQGLVEASSREVAELRRSMRVLEGELASKGSTLEALQGEQRAARETALQQLEEARGENLALRQALMDAELDLERAGAEAVRLSGRVGDLEGSRPVTSQDFYVQAGDPQLSPEAQGPTVPRARLELVQAEAQALEEGLRGEGETLRLQLGAERARAERLQAQVEAAKEQSGGVSEAAERYREQCDERVADLKEQVAGLREASDGHERRAARAEAALTLAEEARQELQHRGSRAAEAQVEAETRLKHALAEKAAVEGRLREASAELQAQRAWAGEAAVQAAHAEGEACRERESLQRDLELARREAEKLQKARETAQEGRLDLEERLAALQARADTLEGRQAEAAAAFERERLRAAELQIETDELREEARVQKDELDRAASAKADLEAGREALLHEGAGLRGEVERLQGATAELAEEKRALEATLREASEAAARKSEEHGALAGQLQAELAEEQRGTSRREEMARAEARREAREEAREELSALRAQVEEQTAIAGALRSEATVARSRAEAAEVEARALSGELSEKAAQVDRLERGREEKSKFSVQRLQGLLYAREKELRHLQRKCRGLEGKLEEFGGDADIFELSPSSTRSGDSPAPSSASGSVSKGARGSPSTPAGSARGGSPLRPVDLNSAP